MSIRKQARQLGYEVVGKLTRCPGWERGKPERWYIDEAGNEYFIRWGVLTIVTAEGGVI